MNEPNRKSRSRMAKRIITGATAQRTCRMLAAIVCGVVVSDSIVAQPADRLTVDVGECVDLKTPEERLACYESRVEAARQSGAATAAPAARATDASPADANSAPRAESSNGGAAAQPAPVAPPTAAAAEPAPSTSASARSSDESADSRQIVATVTDLRETVPNSFVITLDNGQVWAQDRPQWYPMKKGQHVRLRPSQWGSSYRLTVDELRGFIQVSRVR
jgi:hypothetical protein